jgi:hypothetical protein
MNVPSDRAPASASPLFRTVSPTPVRAAERTAAELHREINARRAEVENPELLRRLRSL